MLESGDEERHVREMVNLNRTDYYIWHQTSWMKLWAGFRVKVKCFEMEAAALHFPHLKIWDGVGSGKPAGARVLLITKRSVKGLRDGTEVKRTHCWCSNAVPVRRNKRKKWRMVRCSTLYILIEKQQCSKVRGWFDFKSQIYRTEQFSVSSEKFCLWLTDEMQIKEQRQSRIISIMTDAIYREQRKLA